mmetsp:Transcript_10452/g.28424  ORF Transcript_10452/g.28424 Transcript_10452/m.28424 type:complete len:202 (-) Transcript_10452:273-878(-)
MPLQQRKQIRERLPGACVISDDGILSRRQGVVRPVLDPTGPRQPQLHCQIHHLAGHAGDLAPELLREKVITVRVRGLRRCTRLGPAPSSARPRPALSDPLLPVVGFPVGRKASWRVLQRNALLVQPPHLVCLPHSGPQFLRCGPGVVRTPQAAPVDVPKSCPALLHVLPDHLVEGVIFNARGRALRGHEIGPVAVEVVRQV